MYIYITKVKCSLTTYNTPIYYNIEYIYSTKYHNVMYTYPYQYVTMHTIREAQGNITP
jgi:hypothetical protein